jgi:hypothetical protein
VRNESLASRSISFGLSSSSVKIPSANPVACVTAMTASWMKRNGGRSSSLSFIGGLSISVPSVCCVREIITARSSEKASEAAAIFSLALCRRVDVEQPLAALPAALEMADAAAAPEEASPAEDALTIVVSSDLEPPTGTIPGRLLQCVNGSARWLLSGAKPGNGIEELLDPDVRIAV